MRIFGDLKSGNCLKVKYLCDHLAIPYEWVAVDIMKGESRTPEFLQRSPAGQVPLLDLGGGFTLAQSNAILLYLGEGTPLLPGSRLQRAKIHEWLFWEQYSHEPYIAVCRFHMLFQGRAKAARDDWRVERGNAALALMNAHLSQAKWFVGADFSIADLSLLAYTRLAHEGGFDLTPHEAARDWISRCESRLNLPPVNEHVNA